MNDSNGENLSESASAMSDKAIKDGLAAAGGHDAAERSIATKPGGYSVEAGDSDEWPAKLMIGDVSEAKFRGTGLANTVARLLNEEYFPDRGAEVEEPKSSGG